MKLDNAQTIAALRRLDPALGDHDRTAPALTDAEAGQAAATLARILATDPPRADDLQAPMPAHARRPRRRRWLLAPVGALAAATAVVVPVLVSGGDKAYASWSPTPVALSPAESTEAARACLGSLGQVATRAVTPLIAERRGGWTYVLLRPGGRVQSSCLMPTSEIAGEPTGGRGRWFGSTDEELSEPARDADEVRVDTSATGNTQEGLFRYSEGAVGRAVVDVRFTTPRGVTVKASIANGRFAAWWPAGSHDLDNPEISEAPDVDVTLTDGRTYRLPR